LLTLIDHGNPIKIASQYGSEGLVSSIKKDRLGMSLVTGEGVFHKALT
jgi:hypothetical protein